MMGSRHVRGPIFVGEGAWGMDVAQAKAAAGELATWGRVEVIAAALGHEAH